MTKQKCIDFTLAKIKKELPANQVELMMEGTIVHFYVFDENKYRVHYEIEVTDEDNVNYCCIHHEDETQDADNTPSYQEDLAYLDEWLKDILST